LIELGKYQGRFAVHIPHACEECADVAVWLVSQES